MPLVEFSCRHREHRSAPYQGICHRLEDHRWQLQFFHGQGRRVPDLGVEQFLYISGFLVEDLHSVLGHDTMASAGIRVSHVRIKDPKLGTHR